MVIIVIAVQLTKKKSKEGKEQDVDKKDSRYANKVPPPAAFEQTAPSLCAFALGLSFRSGSQSSFVNWIPVVNPNACLYEDATQRSNANTNAMQRNAMQRAQLLGKCRVQREWVRGSQRQRKKKRV
jgi:hypothetical protein